MAMYKVLRRATAAVAPLAARRAAVPSSSRAFHRALSVKLLHKETTPFVPSRSFSNAIVKDHAEQFEIPENFPFEIEEIEDSTDERIIQRKKILGDRADERMILLKRQYEDETIQVRMPNLGSPTWTVTVFKENGVRLEFDVSADSDEVRIHSLSIKKPGESEDQQVYKVKGPKFSDLEEKLQKAFLKYLEIRGITIDTFNYLNELAIKENNNDDSARLEYLKSVIEK